MNSLCLPSSVGKLCQVLSSVSIQGRFVSQHLTKLKPCTSTNLPVAILRAEGQKTRLKPVTSTGRLHDNGEKLWFNQLCVVSLKHPDIQQTPNTGGERVRQDALLDRLFGSSVNKPTKQRMCQGPSSTGLEYVCPSNTNTSSTIIVDQAVSQNVVVDCPTLPQTFHDISLPELRITEITDPVPHSKDNVDKTPPAKEARQIIKIRRRKMNRHLLKKFKKRMEFTLRKQKLLMKKKKEAVFQARLDTIKKSGVEFDALQFVQKELEKARKGGFQIDVFGSK